ncbi:hypothetical protein DSECCO2_624000 [anaerobic digester metagenome]
MQSPVGLTLLGQGQNGAVLTNQDAIALPWKFPVEDLVGNGADGDVDADHPFQKIAVINRGNRRSHPTLTGRIKVGIGPDHFFLGIMNIIGLIIKIIVGDVHFFRILFQYIKIGIDNVEGIKTVKINGGR